MKKNNYLSKKDKNNAQGMVELALVFPIILLLILGIFEFGRIIFTLITVNTASSEAARFGTAVGDSGGGVSRYFDCNGIVVSGLALSTFTPIEAGDFLIWYDSGPGTALISGDPDTDSDGCAALAAVDGALITIGDRINVKVEITYTPWLSILGFPIPDFPIFSIASRTIVKDLSWN